MNSHPVANSTCNSSPGKRDRTRLALVEAAIEILADKGLEGTSIDELMRVAGMARGTFYNYFESRDALACAASDHIRARLYDSVVDRIPADYTPEETFTCITLGFIHYSLQRPKTGWALVRIGGSSHWVTGDRFSRTRQALCDILPAQVPPFMGLVFIEGIALMVLRRLLEGVINTDEADTVIQLALHGVGIDAEKIPALLAKAKTFVATLDLPA
ncbi:MAG TPA: TetR/AcrR family transcriptional regulator [Pseudomonadales bacterium]|nr:TetR/AcrR family transcriptional regulator [Pseudomonadales bacterium]